MESGSSVDTVVPEVVSLNRLEEVGDSLPGLRAPDADRIYHPVSGLTVSM